MPVLSTIQRHPRYATNAPVEVLHPRAGWQQLRLENISVGGAFVRSLESVVLGARLQLRIPSASGFEADARAVHTLDPAAAARKGHPPGAGLLFEELTPVARSRLNDFVEAVALAATWPQAHATLEVPRPPRDAAGLLRTIAHRIGPCTVEVRADPLAELLDLWARDLSKGRLFIHCEEPLPLRSRLEVRLRGAHGYFTLQAEVVHQSAFEPASRPAYGVGLQLLDFAATRAALEQFTRGAGPAPSPVSVSAPLAEVLGQVKRFFDALERGQVRQALGVPADARLEDERARIGELKALFSRSPAGASAPQLARLDAALRTLTRLERQQAVRDQSLRGELAVKPPEPPPPAPPTRAATVEERRARDRADAQALIGHAEVYVVSDMRARASQAIKQALEHECDEALLLRALAVSVRAEDLGRAVAIGQTILKANPRNAHAWRTLLDIYESKQHYALALRAAQALVRLSPKDRELAARLARLRSASRD